MSTHCYCNDSPFSKARIDHSRKIGHFVRKSDRQKVQRYQCKICGKSFSSATFSEFRYFNYRHLKSRIIKHFSYCGSLRTAKVLLGIDKDTAARYLHKLSRLIEKKNHELIKSQGKFSDVQFDEMESSIHTKLKPVSIPLLVSAERYILDFEIAEMPAKGKLARISKLKYGPRRDERDEKSLEMLNRSKCLLLEPPQITSDKKPTYPRLIKTVHPEARHKTVKGKRGCVTGQAELKKVGFDPLFSLNHTAAMFRARVNRLFRRTWCTSKTIGGLRAHMNFYVYTHNQVVYEKLQWRAANAA